MIMFDDLRQSGDFGFIEVSPLISKVARRESKYRFPQDGVFESERY